MATFAGLKIYNTRTRSLEVFKPLNGNRVFMFVCGPTVYDYSHIGHARVFVFFDVVARWLRRLGYSLFYIVNITDVDDKIVGRAAEEGVHPLDLARKYERYFLEDMASLNVVSPNLYARASDYLREIFEQVGKLLERGHAYVTPTGVYFDITTFNDYGKLSGRDPRELVVHRIEPDPTKRNPGDFALWRVRPKHEFGWDSPWGYGRPGWHIEDTAITIRHFGPQYDIHGGAVELIFPHHEAEIAQAESFTGVKPFVNFWVHVGLLTVGGEKMSKSLGNYVTIREAVSRYGANTLRLYLLQTHYRSPIDFTWDALENAHKTFSKVEVAHSRLEQLEVREVSAVSDVEVELRKKAVRAREGFEEAMNNDLNTAEAIASYLDLISAINDYTNKRSDISADTHRLVIEALNYMNSVLGFVLRPGVAEGLTNDLIRLLVDVRSELRKRKMWELSDKIRDELRRLGVELQDTPSGTKWVVRVVRG
ncbi:MAG: cysteine--tRNA ligase [Desulfurococcaceae archaeon]|nr:cysteine--tRNA ligase [Desulfurococcaceae archaeon]